MKFCHNLRRQKGQVAYLNPPAYSAWYDRNSLRGHRRSWPNCCKRANAEGSQLLSAPVHWSLLCASPYRRAWQRSYRSARWNDSDTPRVSQCPIPRDRSTRRYICKEISHVYHINWTLLSYSLLWIARLDLGRQSRVPKIAEQLSWFRVQAAIDNVHKERSLLQILQIYVVYIAHIGQAMVLRVLHIQNAIDHFAFGDWKCRSGW